MRLDTVRVGCTVFTDVDAPCALKVIEWLVGFAIAIPKSTGLIFEIGCERNAQQRGPQMSSMILRSWICLNKACGEWFDAYEANPACKKCGCVRVSWRPNGGGGIGPKIAPNADHILKTLAADYGLTNLVSPSPSRQNFAKPIAKPPPPSQGSRGRHDWAPGFSSEIYDTPHCAPSLAPVNLRGFVPVGKVMPKGTDMVYRGTTPVARHRPGG